MAISKDKKRYLLTLTPSKVERFQTLSKRLGLPSSTLSNVCDDLIDSVSATFQQALDKGSMEISDLFKVMGQQMELLEADQKEVQRVPKQKRNTLPHAKKHA